MTRLRDHPSFLSAPTAKYVGTVLGLAVNAAQRAGLPMAVREIGLSRENRPIYGVVAGRGEIRVSLTGGAHSDEHIGPLAAVNLVAEMATGARELLDWATWFICPHVNPDGAERNAVWQRDPLDFECYVRGVFREPPGDDVEFNYPSTEPGSPDPRPENRAVAAFLRQGGPFDLHVSLHGMAHAEGAWWLIGKEWVDRTGPLRQSLARFFAEVDLGVHDIERHGEKGFTRIERGFATTPTATAMREHFLRQGDPDTARLFLPSSMEFVQSLGGDPLVMVSELPLFRLLGGGEVTDPPQARTPYLAFREELAEARKALVSGDCNSLLSLEERYDVCPMPPGLLVRAMQQAVLISVDFVRSAGCPRSPRTTVFPSADPKN